MKVIWNPRSYKGSMMSQATLRGCAWRATSEAGQATITELLRLEHALRTGQLDPPVLEREAALQLCVGDRLSPPRRQRAAVTDCCLPDRQITHTPTTSISDRSRVGNRCVSSRRRSATEGAAPRWRLALMQQTRWPSPGPGTTPERNAHQNRSLPAARGSRVHTDDDSWRRRPSGRVCRNSASLAAWSRYDG